MPGGGAFPSTQWSVIRQAGTRGSPSYVTAIDTLCRLYWKPVYGYIRVARASAVEEAKDLTQEFFSGLIEKFLVFRKYIVPYMGRRYQ